MSRMNHALSLASAAAFALTMAACSSGGEAVSTNQAESTSGAAVVAGVDEYAETITSDGDGGNTGDVSLDAIQFSAWTDDIDFLTEGASACAKIFETPELLLKTTGLSDRLTLVGEEWSDFGISPASDIVDAPMGLNCFARVSDGLVGYIILIYPGGIPSSDAAVFAGSLTVIEGNKVVRLSVPESIDEDGVVDSEAVRTFIRDAILPQVTE